MAKMTRDEVEVAINLADHPKFKWACGMKTACGTRIKAGWVMDKWLKAFDPEEAPVPDLNDPATRGCLLEIVRKLGKDDTAYVSSFEEGWSVVVWPEPNVIVYKATEGLALADFIISQSRYI